VSDNTQLNTGTGGDTIRDKDRAGVKTQIVGLDINPSGSEVLGTGDATNGLDVDVTRVQGTVTTSATIAAALPAGNNNIGDVDIASAPYANADGSGTMPSVVAVVAGNDGTNTQALKTDVNGVLQTSQNGTVTVSDGGGSLTVDGTVSVSGAVDTELTTADLDTGAGTDTRAVVGLALAASGGAVLAGAANPVPISDNSGSITVDGTVTANAGTGPFPVSDNGGSLTVDAPVGTPAFVRLSDGASAISALPVTDNGGSLTVDGTVSITANSSVNVAQVAGTTTDTNSGTKSAGTQRVVLATDQPQLTNALKVDGSATTQPVSGTVTANLAPTTTGGLTTSMTISAATTNATSVKASAGQVYGIYCSNINAAVRYLKLFNKASAPTVGTDVPVLVFAIPGNTAGAGFAIEFSNGVAFGTGIAFCLTTGVTTADTGAVAANEQVVNLLYK
jgi:hypothetical protein